MDISVLCRKCPPKEPEKAAPKPAAPEGDKYIPPPKNDTTPIIQPRYYHGDPHPYIGGPIMCYNDPIHIRRMNIPYDPRGYYGGGMPHRHISPFAPPLPPPPHPHYWSMPPPPPPYYGPPPPYYGPPPPPPPPPVSYGPRGYGYDPYDGYYSDDDSYGCVVM